MIILRGEPRCRACAGWAAAGPRQTPPAVTPHARAHTGNRTHARTNGTRAPHPSKTWSRRRPAPPPPSRNPALASSRRPRRRRHLRRRESECGCGWGDSGWVVSGARAEAGFLQYFISLARSLSCIKRVFSCCVSPKVKGKREREGKEGES